MTEIKNEEAMEIKGGGISLVAIGAIYAAITFAIGIIDGFTRPLKCNG